MSTFGLRSARCESFITKIEQGTTPLTLSSGDIVTLDTKVKKIFSGDRTTAADEFDDSAASTKEYDGSDEDSVDSSLPAFVLLRNYDLYYGGDGKHSDAVNRRSADVTAILKARREVLVRNADRDGCACFMDSVYPAGKQRGAISRAS